MIQPLVYSITLQFVSLQSQLRNWLRTVKACHRNDWFAALEMDEALAAPAIAPGMHHALWTQHFCTRKHAWDKKAIHFESIM